MREHIAAHVDIGGTTVVREYWADTSQVTWTDSGGAVLCMAGGRDGDGEAVWSVGWRTAYEIVKGPEMDGG